MEGYLARLIATDRPPAFRLENLGSWARLDDGDVFVNARHATLSEPSLQCKRQANLRVARRRSGITSATHQNLRSQVIGRVSFSSAWSDPQLAGQECHQECHQYTPRVCRASGHPPSRTRASPIQALPTATAPTRTR